MNESTSFENHYTGLTRIKLFFALSRTPHGLLDLATPALCALLWLTQFPSIQVIVLGMITAFAGYTSVYALNDVMDYRTDKEKVSEGWLDELTDDLDAKIIRHPIAHDLLSIKEGIAWVAAWALLALIGAYQLNPVCVLIFLLGCGLEIIYCLMLKVSYLRTLVSGLVKTSGGLAAVFAVDPEPSALFLVGLFFFLFFWELGGQNIPNDWMDIDSDRRLRAKTVPERFGPEKTALLILGFLVLTVCMGVILFQLAPVPFGFHFQAANALLGVYLLLIPAWRLYRIRTRHAAMALFNRASYYPLAILIIVTLKVIT